MTGSVLVVEDDPGLAEALAEALAGEGYRVHVSPHGAAALEWLGESRRPDLVLVDVMMPVMDGPTFRLRQLADPGLAAIPTLAMTAAVDHRLFQMRVDGWLRKPIPLESLLAAARRWCPTGALPRWAGERSVPPGVTGRHARGAPGPEWRPGTPAK
ncbi:response regulator [Myxococcota bacterium]|nr:response regulator [Myxococcota bacterium]